MTVQALFFLRRRLLMRKTSKAVLGARFELRSLDDDKTIKGR